MSNRPRMMWLAAALLIGAALLAACGRPEATGGGGGSGGGGGDRAEARTLVVSGIPDQDPEVLQRQFGTVTDYLAETIGIKVRYEPVADYDAAVRLFAVGDLDLVWFGGLTGVQARLQTPGAEAIAQRDIDGAFHSVFIAGTGTGLTPISSVAGLSALAGKTFTFGSDSSTSGRLMPQFFLSQAGVGLDDFRGEPGFSGSHDATIELVEAGSFEAGVVNEQVWTSRLAEGDVDTAAVQAIFTTPEYHDYHWVVHPQVAERFGDDIGDRIADALLGIDGSDATEKEILELFGAGGFITTKNENYARIEQVARELGKI